MKSKLINLFMFLTIVASSCTAQKMMRSLPDAIKLQKNKSIFIGKSFENLLNQIEPEIKFVYGVPDNRSSHTVGGTYIKLFFISKADVKSRYNIDKEPTGITIRFNLEPKNTRKPIPKGGIDISKKELIHEYGDMIIQGIYVSGEK